jgi:DNA-binding response OmpR family regulator
MREAQETIGTVIVLEPDIIVRTEICHYLRDCGYRVIEGVAAQDAHGVLQTDTRVDVLLTEVNLRGDVGGFELAQEFRQTHPEIAVILVSGLTNLVQKAHDLCGQGPVRKPYRPEEIERRIKALLAMRRRGPKAAEGSG